MADAKISDLTALSAIPDSGDLVAIVDVSDTTMASSGTTKKNTYANFIGKRIVEVQVLDSGTALATGDGKAYFFIPVELNGYNLVDADAAVHTVSSSGTPTIQINNLTQVADMLTTRITIDANEKTSFTAAVAPVIDTANDDVATGDQIRVDIDVTGTSTAGLWVILSFQLP